MKNLNSKYLILSAIILFSLHLTSFSQEDFTLDAQSSKLLITGTSSVHDWEMEASNFICRATMQLEENSVKGISKIDFTCPAKMIKSHNKIMDNKTYKALNTNDFPEIFFEMENESKMQHSQSLSPLKGNLSVAGNTREINVEFEIETNNDNKIVVTGEIPLKMSDFEIKPPKAMMGALKTGNEIVIKYEFVFIKNNLQTTDLLEYKF